MYACALAILMLLSILRVRRRRRACKRMEIYCWSSPKAETIFSGKFFSPEISRRHSAGQSDVDRQPGSLAGMVSSTWMAASAIPFVASAVITALQSSTTIDLRPSN